MVASAQLRGQPETASLTLCGVQEPQQQLLELDAEAGRILRAEAAPFGADAGLHRAQGLAVGVAGDHAGGVEIAPRPRAGPPSDAQQVDALAAGHLDGRDLEVVGDVGDGAQFVRRGQAAPHARHHRIGAVLLDVGVHALVDEARLVVVAVFARPGAEQVVVQRRAAGRAAVRRLPVQRPASPPASTSARCRRSARTSSCVMVGAAAHRLCVRRGRVVRAQRRREQLLDQRRA